MVVVGKGMTRPDGDTAEVLLQDDIDHTGDAVAAVNCGRADRDDLNSFYGCHGNRVQVEYLTAGERGRCDPLAVQEDQCRADGKSMQCHRRL